MPARIKAFIRRPASKELGISEDYIEVDPSTLQLGLLTELYTLTGTQVGGRRTYQRLHGVSHVVNTGIDPSALLDTWATHVSIMEPMLVEGDSSAGQFSSEIKGILADLPQLLELVANGELVTASNTLDGLAYRLMAAIGTATAKLDELEAKATAHGDLAESMVGILTNADDRNLTEAVEFVDAVNAGMEAYGALAAFERDLMVMFDQLEPQSAVWNTLSHTDSGHVWLHEQLDRLVGQEGGFTTRASQFLIKVAHESPAPDEVAVMIKAIDDAEARMRAIRGRIATAVSEHTLAKATSEQLLQREYETERLIGIMRKSRQAVERGMKNGMNAFAVTSGLITTEEFQRWQALLRDPQWHSLYAVGVRLRDMAESIRRLLDQAPRLDEKASKALTSVEQYVERLEAKLTEPTPRSVPSVIDLAAAEDNEAELDDDDNRLQELYELVWAVGAAKYCHSKGYLMGTQLRVILDILEILDRITSEERTRYQEELQELLEGHSHDVEADVSSRGRMALWAQLDDEQIQWIMFKQKRGKDPTRRWHWRLVAHAYEQGQALCSKYGLAPEEIVEAYETRKDERSTLRSSRRR